MNIPLTDGKNALTWIKNLISVEYLIYAGEAHISSHFKVGGVVLKQEIDEKVTPNAYASLV